MYKVFTKVRTEIQICCSKLRIIIIFASMGGFFGFGKKSENDEMTFWDHLDVLRGAIWRSVIVALVLSIIAFAFKDILFDTILLAPKSKDFITYRVLCRLGNMLSMPSLCVDPSNFDLIKRMISCL